MSTITQLIEQAGGIVQRRLDATIYEWMRQVSNFLDGNNPFMNQTTWFIDPVNGNDANNGETATTALKTDGERQRRMGPNPVWNAGAYHVHYLNDLPGSDPVIYAGIRTSKATIFLHGSTIDGHGQSTLFTIPGDAVVVPLNRATNTPWQIASASLPVSWTASGLVDKRIRRTNGTPIRSWVIKDLGTKNARCCQFLTQPTYAPAYAPPISSTGTPINGDTFVIEKLTVIPVFMCILQEVDDFTVNAGTGFIGESLDLGSLDFRINTSETLSFDGCILSLWNPAASADSDLELTECRIANAGQVGFSAVGFFAGYTSVNLTVYGTSLNCLFMTDFTSQTRSVTLRGGRVTFNGFATFDAGSPIVGAGPGLYTFQGTMWGSGNNIPVDITGVGVVFQNVLASTAFNWTGSMADIRIVGRTTEHAFDDVAGTYTAARATSFANLAATVAGGGFGNNLLSPVKGSGIVAST